MRNFAPALTLRAVAEMLLPHDHAEISRVEGRPKMADAVVTDVTGALDCGVVPSETSTRWASLQLSSS